MWLSGPLLLSRVCLAGLQGTVELSSGWLKRPRRKLLQAKTVFSVFVSQQDILGHFKEFFFFVVVVLLCVQMLVPPDRLNHTAVPSPVCLCWSGCPWCCPSNEYVVPCIINTHRAEESLLTDVEKRPDDRLLQRKRKNSENIVNSLKRFYEHRLE